MPLYPLSVLVKCFTDTVFHVSTRTVLCIIVAQMNPGMPFVEWVKYCMLKHVKSRIIHA